MSQKVQKWGNSLAVRIPKALAEQLHINEGTPFSLVVEGDSLVIRKEKRKPRYTLEELLASVDENNLHPETDWGADVGRERLESYDYEAKETLAEPEAAH